MDPSNSIRMRIWNNLANIKFKVIYASECSRFADKTGNIYSFFLSIASASSVAAWALWQRIPGLWAGIVAIAQVLHIAKPYIPFMKHDKEYLEQSFEFETLYLGYEKLWFEYEDGRIEEMKAEEVFYKFREKETEIERSYKNACCPNFKFILDKAQKATVEALSRNF